MWTGMRPGSGPQSCPRGGSAGWCSRRAHSVPGTVLNAPGILIEPS